MENSISNRRTDDLGQDPDNSEAAIAEKRDAALKRALTTPPAKLEKYKGISSRPATSIEKIKSRRTKP
jgi:hypothetical protein